MGTFKYRPEVDGLRSVAVVSVILGHLGVKHFENGYIGVDIFFAISGYLIIRIIHDGLSSENFSFVEFYQRRIKRIFPALFSTVLVTFLASFILLFPKDLVAFAKSAIWTSLSASNVFFALNGGYFTGPSELKPLLHTWSLGVEEQFYLVMPITLYVAFRFFRKSFWLLYLLGFACSFALAVLIAQFHIFDLSEKSAFFQMPLRAWELMAGGFVALLPALAVLGARWGRWLCLGGLALIGLSVAGIGLVDSFPGLGAVPAVLGAVMLIASSGTWTSLLLANPPMVFIGKISYSLYLIHWPILSLYRYSVQRPLTPVEMAVLAAATFLLAAISWRWIEIPLRQITIGRNTVWLSSVAAIVLVVGLGLAVIKTEGAPGRFPKEIVDLAGGVGFTAPPPPCEGSEGALPFCRYGPADLSGPTIALIGDSHAEYVQSAFVAAMRARGIGVVVATNRGCPPLLRINSPNTGDNCARTNQRLYRELAGDSRIEAVLLASRWPLAAERWGYDVGPIRVVDDSGRSGPGVFSTAAQTSIGLLSQSKTVFVLGPIPEQVRRGLTSAAIERRAGRSPVFGITAQQNADRTRQVDRVFSDLAARGLIQYYRPAAIFCDQRQCLAANGRDIWYADDNHLTAQGALRLQPQFDAMADTLLKKAP